MLDRFAKTIIVTGHYGSGKTNLAINLAIDYRRRGQKVALVDLDIVNPYFRTADFGSLADQEGITLVASPYANSSLDIPSLTINLESRLGQEGVLIVDVGGDDAGAVALGRYAPRILERPYTMLYVINCFRYLTRQPEEALELKRDIELVSRLKVTDLVNNSNLSYQTGRADIEKSIAYAEKTAGLCGAGLAFTAVKRDLAETLSDLPAIYPVDVYVTVPWN